MIVGLNMTLTNMYVIYFNHIHHHCLFLSPPWLTLFLIPNISEGIRKYYSIFVS